MGKIILKTNKVLTSLFNNGNMDTGALSVLRSVKSLESLRAQKVWPLLLPVLDEEDLSITGQPTYAENAIFNAIRLYAIYQQGNDKKAYEASFDESKDGYNIFSALKILKDSKENSTSLDHRIEQILSSTNFYTVISALNGLINILKGSKMFLKIDFALLAQDLYQFQFGFEESNKVRLRWGQQYYR